MAEAVHLTLHDVHAGYEAVDILHGVSLDITRGEFVCLLGPNGAGKSTLLKSVFGMARMRSGDLVLDGATVAHPTPAAMLRRGVAYVPQGRCNFPLMSVAENLEMAAHLRRDKAEVRSEIERLKQRFPVLAASWRKPASHLSGGQQQILELAMALVRRPRLLLIDEPSMGLAPGAVVQVFDELRQLQAQGLTVLLVEQNTKAALAASSRAVVLRLGKIVWSGPAASLTPADLADLFLAGTAPAADGASNGSSSS